MQSSRGFTLEKNRVMWYNLIVANEISAHTNKKARRFLMSTGMRDFLIGLGLGLLLFGCVAVIMLTM